MKYEITLKEDSIPSILRMSGKMGISKIKDDVEVPTSLSVRLQSNPSIFVKFFTSKNNIDIEYQVQGSALLNVAVFDNFKVRARIATKPNGNPGFTLLNQNSIHPRVRNWLNLPKMKVQFDGHDHLSDASNLDFLCIMYYIAGMCVCRFPFAMDGKYSPDGEKLFLKLKPNYDTLIANNFWSFYNKQRLEHMFDGWDTVTLTESELARMANYVQGLQDATDTTEYACPLDHFCFRCIEDSGAIMLYFYSIHGNTVDVTVNTETPGEQCAESVSFTASVSPSLGATVDEMKIIKPPKDPKWMEFLNEITDGHEYSNFHWVMASLYTIEMFMLFYAPEAMAVDERVCKKPSKSGTHHSERSDRQTVRLMKSYTLKKNWVNKVERKKAQITCPCWGVKGHFRHYKNGKVIFIHPFVKGKERGKYVGKDYVLS